MSRALKIAIALAGVAAVAVSVLIAIVTNRRNHPSATAITAFVTDQLKNPAVHVVTVTKTESAAPSGLIRIDFGIQAESAYDLFERSPTADFMATKYPADLAAVQSVTRMLESASGARLIAEARISAKPPNPLEAVILRVATPQHSALTYEGSVEAYRANDQWQFRLVRLASVGTSLYGAERSSFGPITYVDTNATDMATFRTMVDEYKACGAKLEEARARLAAALKAERDAREKAFIALLQPGTVFRGAAVRTNDQRSTPLFVEIAELRPESREIVAILRNDGGWADRRRVTGTYHYDGETFALELRSDAQQAIEGAGPILQDDFYGGLQLPLTLGADGTLRGQTNLYVYQLARVAPDDVAALRARINAPLEAALAATARGSVYHGAAVSKSNHASQEILVRFKTQDDGGALLVAEIENPERPSQHRTLHGTILANSYRSKGQPVRLNFDPSDAVRAASDATVFGTTWTLSTALRPDDNGLVGEDDRFTYKLVRATPQYLADLEAARRAKAQAFHAVIRPGAEYDGTVRDQQGFASRVRLRVARVESGDQTVVVVMESREQNGIFHEFSGAYDDLTGEIKLGSTGHGRFNPSGVLRVPFFSSDSTFQVQLVVGASAITGELKGWQNWEINVPVGAVATTAPNATSSTAVDPATGLPPYPTAQNAYALIGGRWEPLPRNKGRLDVSPLSAVTGALAGINGVLGALTGNRDAASNPSGVVASGLIFDGVDPRPRAPGERVIIVYVGPIKKVPDSVLAQYPALRDYPVIEIEPTQQRSDGARVAPLQQLEPGFAGFGTKRLAAFVESPASGVVTLTASGPVATGTYAVSVGDQAFELDVQ